MVDDLVLRLDLAIVTAIIRDRLDDLPAFSSWAIARTDPSCNPPQ
jgi:hypothetical protein